MATMDKAANACDTNYTSVAKIAKRYLGRAGVPMEDAHARLRELAGEYRG
jgi:amidase